MMFIKRWFNALRYPFSPYRIYRVQGVYPAKYVAVVLLKQGATIIKTDFPDHMIEMPAYDGNKSFDDHMMNYVYVFEPKSKALTQSILRDFAIVDYTEKYVVDTVEQARELIKLHRTYAKETMKLKNSMSNIRPLDINKIKTIY